MVFAIESELITDKTTFDHNVTFAYEIDDIVLPIGVEGRLNGDEKELLIVPGIGFDLIDDVELAIEVPIGLTPKSSN